MDAEASEGPLSFHGVGDDLPGRHACLLDGKMTSLHARHVQNVLDEAIHPGRGALDRVGRLSRSALWFSCAAPKQTRLHRDGTEWISKVMSDETEHLITDLGCLD